LVVAGAAAGFFVTSAAPVAATTPAYELFCPGTPVGTIVMNGVITTGAITPPAPSSGTAFSVTNYQDRVTIPASIVSAAAALGNTAIVGTATAKVDATGALPASISTGLLHFSTPIPSPVPPSGLTLRLPTKPGRVGPFTASGGAVTVRSDQTTKLTLIVSGSPLKLTCTDYPDNSLPTGIVTGKPGVPPISPVIATTTATTKVTAQPSSGLADGQTITVVGSGFSPGADVALVECQTGSTGATGCDLSTVQFVTASGTGGFSSPYIVARLLAVNGTRIDCATRKACVLGAGNVADETQEATTPLAFNPKIRPLPPLKLAGTLDPAGTVVRKTGVATISGTITCNRPVVAQIQGELSQIYLRFIFRSFSAGQITCAPKAPLPWTLTFQPDTGLFAKGAATAQVTLSGSVEGTTSQVPLAGRVRLKDGPPAA